MICSNCQTVNPENAKFCSECGTKLVAVCPKCSHENAPGAKFCNNCGHKLSAGSKPLGVSQKSSGLERFIPQELAAKLDAARSSRAMEGERRVVTMLFCDVKGSTKAAEQLDPEEWTEIMNGAFEYMIQPIYQFEGMVARLMGDAVLAFFGAPIAHEDDPQRAVLAGLGIVEGIKEYRKDVKLNWGIEFDVRVGINTGLVVVGAVGSDLRMEYTAMGDAINLAARMEQTAVPGTVQIAEDTFSLVAPVFDVEELGGIEVKGKSEPVQTYRVLGRKGTPGRSRGIEGLESPLIGRDQEFGKMKTALEGLHRGVGGILCLIGEAGLGKSRIIRELKTAADGQGSNILWHETTSLSYETNQPYSLFRRLIRRLIGADPGDSPQVLREKIGLIVEGVPPEEAGQVRRVFESIFGLTGENGEPPLEGETFKGMLFTVMFTLWHRRATHRPVVAVCDDLHWSDQASIDLLLHLFPLTEQVPLLLLCALRPDRKTPGWGVKVAAERDYPHRYTELSLEPLTIAEGSQLVESLLTISELPVRLKERILEKSEGNPFFIEEVLRTLIDQGVVVRDGSGSHWLATGEGEDIEIPGNLQTLLVARIDRLAEDAQRTLQVASVVGRSFYYRVLQRIVDLAEELDTHLLTLQRVELIREAARLPEIEYIFRHTLTQEAAYSTILLRQRREFHLRVGEVIEALFPDQVDEMAATIAHHFFQAREYERALGYYVRAGDSAYRLHALKEARDHYTRGLEIAKRDGLQCDRDLGQVLKHLYLQLGRTWELELRYDDALEIYQEMQDEADRRGDQGLKLANLTALGTVFSVGASSQMDFERSKKVSEDGLALAKTLGDRQAEARILWNLMLVHHYVLKDNKTAVRYGEESLAIARDLDPKEQLAFTLNDMQRVYTELGDLQRAKEVAAEAQALFRSLDNLPMLSDNLGVYALINFHGGNFEKVVEIANECIQVARIMGSDHHLLMTNFLYFIVAHERGNYGLAMQKIDGWNYFANMADHTEAKVVGITLKSWLYAELGQIEPGMEFCSQAFEIAGTLSQTAREHINACLTHLHLLKNDLSRASQTFNETQFDLSKATSTDFLIYFTHTVSAMDYTLAVGEYERTIEIADASISYREPAGIEAGLADAYYLRGKALKALGRETEAYSDLGKGAMIAEEIGSNRILWKILGAMGEIEDLRGYSVEAGQLRAKAQGIVKTIADHTGKEEWRKSFLESRKVQSIFH